MDTTTCSNASSIIMNHVTHFPTNNCYFCKNLVSPEDVCALEPCAHGPFHHSCVVQIEKSDIARAGPKSVMYCPQCNSAIDQILYDFLDGIPRGSRTPFSPPRRTQLHETIPKLYGIPPSISCFDEYRPNMRTNFMPHRGSLSNQIEPSAPFLEESQPTSLKHIIQETSAQTPVGAHVNILYPTPSESTINNREKHQRSFPTPYSNSYTPRSTVYEQYQKGDDLDANTQSMPNLREKKFTKPRPPINLKQHEMIYGYESMRSNPQSTDSRIFNSPHREANPSSWNESWNSSPLRRNIVPSPPHREDTFVSERRHEKRSSRPRSSLSTRRGKDVKEDVRKASHKVTVRYWEVTITPVTRDDKNKSSENSKNASEGKARRLDDRRDTRSTSNSSRQRTRISSFLGSLRTAFNEL